LVVQIVKRLHIASAACMLTGGLQRREQTEVMTGDLGRERRALTRNLNRIHSGSHVTVKAADRVQTLPPQTDSPTPTFELRWTD
jgi:hypothetical protein